MPKFEYIGPYERTYPDILTDGGSLVVRPGDIREFDEGAPHDGWWITVPPPAIRPDLAKKMADS